MEMMGSVMELHILGTYVVMGTDMRHDTCILLFITIGCAGTASLGLSTVLL